MNLLSTATLISLVLIVQKAWGGVVVVVEY